MNKCKHKWIFDYVEENKFPFWNKLIFHCEKCCMIKTVSRNEKKKEVKKK